MIKKVNSLIKKTVREQRKLNSEFEILSKENSDSSEEIRSSIKKKSAKFHSSKVQRSSLFDSIRNK